ncbi:MAG: HDOD domain-containing protein [Planctomycetota bacterium]
MPPEPIDLIATLSDRAHNGKLTLPVLPIVAIELLASVDDDDCDARSLAERVQRDPSLAAHVLRIANSARFAPKEPIVSLTQAIGRLGMGTLREIVISVVVKGSVFKVKGHEEYVEKLWDHALLSGRLAQEIARARRANVEAAFLCGLLHDIGAPVALQGLVDLCKETGFCLIERAMVQTIAGLHQEIGAKLIESWKLADWVYAAVRYHHQPEDAPNHRELVRTTALADALAYWLEEDEGEGLPPGMEHAADLELYEEDIQSVVERGSKVHAEAKANA